MYVKHEKDRFYSIRKNKFCKISSGHWICKINSAKYTFFYPYSAI